MEYQFGTWDIVWLVFILFSVIPAYRRWQLQRHRVTTLRRFEKMRGSRAILMIHRQEALKFLGIPLTRYIDIEDSEKILRAIRLTPNDLPIDLVLHTPGGLVLAAEQIAHALKKHPGTVTVFVPHYAMSGGTMMALAADQIVMDENAVLGPVDPQVGQWPAASILTAARAKPAEDADDETLILADVARKAISQVEATLRDLLGKHLNDADARRIARILSEGRWTHDYPLGAEELRALGIEISTELPRQIYELMELFPQPAPRRPSVQYVPIPYHDHNGQNRGPTDDLF